MIYQNTPKVSVVMSVYNGSLFTKDAVSSILNQTFADFELIIINDGSTDMTTDILQQFVSDPRVHLIHQKHIGLTRSLRFGTALAQGLFIARQDADDISLPSRLEQQVEFLDLHPEAGIIGSQVELIDQRDIHLGFLNLPMSHIEVSQVLPTNNCLIHGSVMMRRQCIEMIGGYRNDFYMAQDYDLWLRMLGTFKIFNLPHVQYKYRKSSTSISQRMHTLYETYIDIAQTLLKERNRYRSDVLDREGRYSFWEMFGKRLKKARADIVEFSKTTVI